MHSAKDLRQITNESVNEAELDKIVEELTERFKWEANLGNTEAKIYCANNDFSMNNYNYTKQLQVEVVSRLHELGFQVEQRIGCNGIYFVARW